MPVFWKSRPRCVAEDDPGRLRLHKTLFSKCAMRLRLQLFRLRLLQQPVQQKLQMKRAVFGSWLAIMALLFSAGLVQPRSLGSLSLLYEPFNSLLPPRRLWQTTCLFGASNASPLFSQRTSHHPGGSQSSLAFRNSRHSRFPPTMNMPKRCYRRHAMGLVSQAFTGRLM